MSSKLKPVGLDAQVVVRTTHELRDAFIAVCKQQDMDASKEIRKFMRSYVARYGQKALKF